MTMFSILTKGTGLLVVMSSSNVAFPNLTKLSQTKPNLTQPNKSKLTLLFD